MARSCVKGEKGATVSITDELSTLHSARCNYSMGCSLIATSCSGLLKYACAPCKHIPRQQPELGKGTVNKAVGHVTSCDPLRVTSHLFSFRRCSQALPLYTSQGSMHKSCETQLAGMHGVKPHSGALRLISGVLIAS